MNAELHEIVTADGSILRLNDDDERRVMLYPSNAGLPPIKWITDNPFQIEGVVERGYKIQERTITLEVRFSTASRERYYEAREVLLNKLRPNRLSDTTPLQYTFIRADDTRRAIYGRALSPQFQRTNPDISDEHGFTETIIIECFDPIFFDPKQVSSAFGLFAADTDLSLPASFPLSFGGIGNATIDLTYAGTWYSYPTLVVSGQCENWRLTNLATGKVVIFNKPMTANEVVTLNLSKRTLVNNFGENLWGYLSPVSNIVSFKIEPDAVVPNGTQTLQFLANAGADALTAQLQYYTRYAGI